MLIGEKKLKKIHEEQVNKPYALRDKHNIKALKLVNIHLNFHGAQYQVHGTP